MPRWFSIFLLLWTCALAAACGSPKDDGPRGDGGDSQVVTIRGGERMSWNQDAPSAQALGDYSFRLLVDGALASLTDVQCNNTRIQAGYQCLGRLPSIPPGQHSLQLVAVVNGVQSNLSAPLLVRVASTLISGEAPLSGAVAASATATEVRLCLPRPAAACYIANQIAAGLGRINALVTSAADQAFFVEEGSRVRLIQDGALDGSPVELPELAGKRLISLAVPPDFDRTRMVFVLWGESSPEGRERLFVTRYREMRGTLAQPATIVSDLPVSRGASVPVAIDDEGHLYLAIPSISARELGGRGNSEAVIVRLTGEGTVPRSNPSSTPVIAPGFAVPSSLAWDSGGRRLWLAGTDSRWQSPVLALPIVSDGRIGRVQKPSLEFSDANGFAEASSPFVALVEDADPDRSATMWLIGSGGRAFRGPLSADPVVAFSDVRLDAIGSMTLVAPGRNRTLFVVSTSGASGLSIVWRLTPTP